MSSAASLVCLLPVRNAAGDLPDYLRSAARFCDAIVALDDGSTDDTRELLQASPLVKALLTNPRREGYRGWNDGENRNRLLRTAAELDPEWILWIDADERMDAGDARALREFVRRDALPGCAYGFEHYWVWGRRRYDPRCSWIFRLFAYEPGQTLPRRRLHFNPVPTAIPPKAWIRTTIRVQHLGVATEERRLGRLAKYREADPRGKYGTDLSALSRKPPGDLPVWRRRPPGLPVLIVPEDRPAQALLVNPPREDYRGWDDSQNRNRLLQAAAELDPVWILSLDADERIDPGDAAALRDFVERDALPGLAYGFKVHRMVEDLGRYDRADLWVYRLFACEPGQRFPIQRLHFVPVPTSIPRARWLPTTIRIQHVGSLTEERRRARVDKYRQADAENAFQPDYANLLAPPREVKGWQPRPADLPVLATPTATGRLALFRPESIDPDAPAISAVVIAQNDEGEIERSVQSVVEQECPEPFEVIVVTSGTDRTAALVREKFPDVTLVELPRPVLPGEARNVGLRVARGDYVSFPGSHVELPQGSLAARLRAHDLGYAMVTGTMLNGTRTWAGWASYFLDHSTVLPGRPSGPLQGPPAHCSYVRDLLLQVGGFPEDMRAGEDTVVNWELNKRGYAAYRSQEVRLVHHSPCRGPLRLLRHHFVRGRALGRILLGRDGGPARRRRWPILRSLLLRYIPRRVSVTSDNVKRWGRDHRRTYRLAYPLVVAGAVAALAGACYEVLRPARRMADVREPRLGGQQTPAGEAAPVGER